jgi:hypothetical protein
MLQEKQHAINATLESQSNDTAHGGCLFAERHPISREGNLLPVTFRQEFGLIGWFNLPAERPKLVNLKDWYRQLCSHRAPYQKHIMITLT